VKGSFSVAAEIATFDILQQMAAILGGTKTTFWPFLEGLDQNVRSYYEGVRDLTSKSGGATNILETAFEPYRHPGGVHSYLFDSAASSHLGGSDDDAYSFGDGTIDSPFSVGAWILPRLVGPRTIIAKYDPGVGVAREWDFRFTAASLFGLELYDESADATEIAGSTTALTLNRWASVIAAYDGGETSPVINLYFNGVLDNDGSSAETGAYVAMENTATPPVIGARGLSTLPVQLFNGRIALPFICGKQISAAEALSLYQLGRQLVGV